MKRYALALVLILLLLVGCSVDDVSKQEGLSSGDESTQTSEVTSADDESTDGAADENDTGEDYVSDVDDQVSNEPAIDEDGTYTSKEEVALYIHTYGHLPDNFVTKDEAEDAGWKTEGLDIDEACPGCSIGGDRFGNREGKLPKAKGRTWYECDIDYHGGRSRGAKRIVYSNDGLIYYTQDHYESFEQLY